MCQPFGLAAFLLGALLFFPACGKPPTQELLDADNAVNAAILAGAEDYAPAELKIAQDALAEANTKLENKDYQGAKEAALEAKAKAEGASTAIEENKLTLMAEAESLLNALKPEVAGLQSAAAKLKGKGTEPVKADAAGLKALFNAAQNDFDGRDFKAAAEKLRDASIRLETVKAAAEAARQAAAAARKK